MLISRSLLHVLYILMLISRSLLHVLHVKTFHQAAVEEKMEMFVDFFCFLLLQDWSSYFNVMIF